MATILNLLKGTQKVLPVALKRLGDGRNSPIKQVRVQEFKSIKTVQVLSTQRASGRFPKSDRSIAKSGFYKQQVKFIYEDREDVGNRKPSLKSDKAKVSCTCDAHYYYFWFFNKKNDAHAGSNFPRYERKTPPPPEGREEKNPTKTPGMCKHLAFLVRELEKSRSSKLMSISILESLLETFQERMTTTVQAGSDSGIHHNQRMQGQDGELDADPDADRIDTVNRKNIAGGTDKNKKDFENDVYTKDKAGKKPSPV